MTMTGPQVNSLSLIIKPKAFGGFIGSQKFSILFYKRMPHIQNLISFKTFLSLLIFDLNLLPFAA